MNRKHLIAIFGTVALVALALLFLPSLPTRAPLPVRSAALTDCDLNSGPCSATLDGAQVQLSVEPRPLAAMKPLTVTATVNGTTPRRAAVDFAGVDMNMGQNRFGLKSADGRYTGTAMLPICTRGSMLWEATLLIDTGEAELSFPFRFETRR